MYGYNSWMKEEIYRYKDLAKHCTVLQNLTTIRYITPLSQSILDSNSLSFTQRRCALFDHPAACTSFNNSSYKLLV